jgi:uncharacterized membrane protein YebE (DUF533 family)
MKKKLLNQLKSQQLELIHLISINLIATTGKADKGQLNNLQRALKLNEEITKQVQQWES